MLSLAKEEDQYFVPNPIKQMEIRISNLSKDFSLEGKKFRALDQVDLTIPANQIFTILGPSGCGKTTLLRCIVGLETPDSGEIAIGEEIVFSKEKSIFIPPEKRGLGMVFQTYAIWPHMNVFENVAYPLQARREPKEKIKRKVAEVLQLVQLAGFENRPATKLSGGQQQRVALARALVAEPKVILFDEPLSNLDAKLREETRKELRRFLTRLKITAVYVTHDQAEALSLSDTIAVMNNGRIVEIGTPRDIYFHSEHKFVADFIGRANILEGQVRAIENNYLIIDTSLGPIVCQKKREIEIGKKVYICIRPEFIKIIKTDQKKGPNIFLGKIESLVFSGDLCEGEVGIGQISLNFQVEPTSPLQEGEEIFLQFPPDHCQILLH